MINSYCFTLERRAVVVTTDLTAKNLHMLRSNHWLKDPRHVVLVWLTEAAWLTLAETTAAEGASVEAWSVGEVTAFCEGHDAVGLVEVLRRSAVTGADLLAFQSAADVARELNMTPFAARKVLSLRDSELR